MQNDDLRTNADWKKLKDDNKPDHERRAILDALLDTAFEILGGKTLRAWVNDLVRFHLDRKVKENGYRNAVLDFRDIADSTVNDFYAKSPEIENPRGWLLTAAENQVNWAAAKKGPELIARPVPETLGTPPHEFSERVPGWKEFEELYCGVPETQIPTFALLKAHRFSDAVATIMTGVIDGLTARRREAFRYVALFEYSPAEGAQRMGITTNNFGVILYRARQDLRPLLASQGFSADGFPPELEDEAEG